MTRPVPPGLLARLLARFHAPPSDTAAASATQADPFPQLRADDIAAAQCVHDLRNQLAIIRGCAELIESLVPGRTAEAEIHQLMAATERADRLTRQILRTTPSCGVSQPTDLNDIVMGVVGSLSPYVGGDVTLRTRLPLDPVLVASPAADLERIVVNLVLYSFDAINGSGCITIDTGVTVAASRLEIDGPPAGRYARLVVTDTGCGMLPEVRAHMFEPFFTTKAGGTGLG